MYGHAMRGHRYSVDTLYRSGGPSESGPPPPSFLLYCRPRPPPAPAPARLASSTGPELHDQAPGPGDAHRTRARERAPAGHPTRTSSRAPVTVRPVLLDVRPIDAPRRQQSGRMPGFELAGRYIMAIM